MGTELIIIRHGQTDWNKEDKFQGHQDIDLNSQGRCQAQKTADFLSTKKINQIYSSDLKRCYHTAEVINDNFKLQIKQKKKLRELNFGEWEGLSYCEIKKKDPDLLANWQQKPGQYLPPGGENMDHFCRRIKNSVKKLVEENEEKTVLVVTHGGVIRILLTIILRMEPQNYWQFKIDQASVNIINFYGSQAIISLLNMKSHLKGC